MARVLQHNIVPQTCGVGWIGQFRGDDEAPAFPKVKDVVPIGGCGWVMAGFTNANPAYKEAYEEMKARWKEVYRSPTRKNTRTGRMFFFSIFDTKEKP